MKTSSPIIMLIALLVLSASCSEESASPTNVDPLYSSEYEQIGVPNGDAFEITLYGSYCAPYSWKILRVFNEGQIELEDYSQGTSSDNYFPQVWKYRAIGSGSVFITFVLKSDIQASDKIIRKIIYKVEIE